MTNHFGGYFFFREAEQFEQTATASISEYETHSLTNEPELQRPSIWQNTEN